MEDTESAPTFEPCDDNLRTGIEKGDTGVDGTEKLH